MWNTCKNDSFFYANEVTPCFSSSFTPRHYCEVEPMCVSYVSSLARSNANIDLGREFGQIVWAVSCLVKNAHDGPKIRRRNGDSPQDHVDAIQLDHALFKNATCLTLSLIESLTALTRRSLKLSSSGSFYISKVCSLSLWASFVRFLALVCSKRKS